MATSAVPVDLDVLPADDEAGASGPPIARGDSARDRRRWPWVLAALVLAGVAVAFPVRARLSVAQLDRLDRRWQEALALDHRRSALVMQLQAAATPDDRDQLTAATAALDDEVAGRFDRLRTAISAERILDTGIRRLAGAQQTQLAITARELRARRSVELDAAHTAGAELARQRERWNRRPARAPTAATPLTAADTTLAGLQRWLDEPTGVVLVAASGGSLVAFDVDGSRVTAVQPTVRAETVLARRGFVAALAEGTVSVVTLEGTRATSTHRVGTADNLFPAARSDAFWMVDNVPVPGSLGASRTVAVEVDADGKELARWEGSGSIGGPARITEEPVAETAGGLLVHRTGTVGQPNLQIVHLDGTPGPALSGVGFPFAASTRDVAWIDNTTPEHQLHVWSGVTGADRVVPAPAGREIAGMGDFSPDGSTLTVSYVPAGGRDGAAELGLVDAAAATAAGTPGSPGTTAAEAAVRLVPGASTLRLTSTAWSPDGRRLFLAGRGPHPLATYRLDDPAVHLLRAHDVSVDRFAVVAAGL